jgi:lipopolysaccharide/colanic/teichoic acid biosynthesis glycosyltransferase
MIIRTLDIIFSFLGILLLSPILVVISLMIILESRGGVFYRQSRVGQHGINYTLLKFRSMHAGSDKKGLLTVGENDQRITRVGSFIRKYKLDELPQLWNVLWGNMSMVGPRPEVPKYVKLYTNDQKKVLQLKPGITDLASLEYFNENELLSKVENPEDFYINEVMPKKIELNMMYIENPSVANYISIIQRTIIKIFK